MKPPLLRQAAEQDIDRAFTYYLREAGSRIATSFVDSVDVALMHIGHHPGSGSLRYGELIDVSGLRTWALNRFPYAVFYVEHEDHLDVLRVLHQHSDIPALLQD